MTKTNKQPVVRSEPTSQQQGGLRAVWAVIKGERQRLLVSPAAYVVFASIALLWFFLFFRQVFLIGESSLRLLFSYLPWLGVILLPALTMGAIARERTAHTLEWSLTRPIKEIELILGKWLSLCVYVFGLLLLTLPLAIAFAQFGQMDWGVYAAQFLSAWLLLASFAAIGTAISSWLREQLSALLVSVLVLFSLTLIGFELVTARLPVNIAQVVAQASVLVHAEALSRGVLDVRDLWYFVVVIVLSLSLAVLKLSREKYGRQKKGYRWAQVTVGLLSVVLILSIVFSQRVPGRIDLTADRLFSLEPVTTQLLQSATQPITLTLYASDSLPAQLQPVLRDVKDILRDYDQLGGDNVIVSVKNPSGDSTIAQEAVERGVQEVQFNQISQESFQVNSGFLGVSVSLGEQHLAAPIIQSISGLEYELTSLIAQLTKTDKPRIAVTAGHGEKSLFGELQILNQLLSRQFTLESVNLTEAEEGELAESLAGFDAVILAGPTGPFETIVIDELQRYASAGGSLFVLAEGAEVEPQNLSVAPAQHNVNQVTAPFDVGVRENLVFDPSSSEVVRLGAGQVQYLIPYPWWVKALTDENSAVVQKSQSVLMPWVSEVGVLSGSSTEGIEAVIVSTPNADSSSAAKLSIDPNTPPVVSQAQSLTLGLAVEKRLDDAATNSARLILIGDADFLSDGVMQNAPQNAGFVLDALAWLSRDTSLAALQSKVAPQRSLLFSQSWQPTGIIVITYGVAVGLPLMISGVVYLRRRRLQKRVFSPLEL